MAALYGMPMLKMTSSVCIDAPVARVWFVLSDLESIPLWVRAIRHAQCPAQSRGSKPFASAN
jgi:uncharacterized membrane protein